MRRKRSVSLKAAPVSVCDSVARCLPLACSHGVRRGLPTYEPISPSSRFLSSPFPEP